MKNIFIGCKIFIFIIIIIFSGCEMFEPHPYSGKIDGELHINAKNIELIENRCISNKQIKFAVISDSQGWYNQLEDFVEHLNGHSDLDFVLHLGDFTDYGVTSEFILQRNILQKLKVPYVSVIGNHDCIGNGEDIFLEIFGQLDYSFTAGDIQFVMLNTNALEFDNSKNVPNFLFIEKLLATNNLENKRTIVAMHAPPRSEQLMDNLSKVFHDYIKRFPNLMFCLNGHGHHFTERDIFNDGIIYYECTCINKRGYYLFTVTPDGYEKEIIEF
ncbi:MAG: metallophosphoesterase [Bacteroidales bacterium]|nr:metallophosphoesterase [Bacteroidales bacterium]